MLVIGRGGRPYDCGTVNSDDDGDDDGWRNLLVASREAGKAPLAEKEEEDGVERFSWGDSDLRVAPLEEEGALSSMEREGDAERRDDDVAAVVAAAGETGGDACFGFSDADAMRRDRTSASSNGFNSAVRSTLKDSTACSERVRS